MPRRLLLLMAGTACHDRHHAQVVILEARFLIFGHAKNEGALAGAF